MYENLKKKRLDVKNWLVRRWMCHIKLLTVVERLNRGVDALTVSSRPASDEPGEFFNQRVLHI
jgi:hypothetical protein